MPLHLQVQDSGCPSHQYQRLVTTFRQVYRLVRLRNRCGIQVIPFHWVASNQVDGVLEKKGNHQKKNYNQKVHHKVTEKKYKHIRQTKLLRIYFLISSEQTLKSFEPLVLT